jgi:NAD(P)-dependent dehydrogenase (short-subunit alcohol dehydrogenase family)
MGLQWSGMTAVVTGAGSGIGKALSLELARRGAALAVSDIDGDTAEATALESRAVATHRPAVAYTLDVADRSAVLHHAEQVAADFGSINLVVNNAGVAMQSTVSDTPFEDIDWLLGIDLGGVVNGTKAFLPHLVRSGDGHLVNISSVFGLIAAPSQAFYSTAKFAVRAFTESLRQELDAAKAPVTVHCVHPGGVRTSIAESARYPRRPDQPAADPLERAASFERIARTSPESAARAILRGVELDRARILVGVDARVIDVASRVLGAHYMPALARLARRVTGD